MEKVREEYTSKAHESSMMISPGLTSSEPNAIAMSPLKNPIVSSDSDSSPKVTPEMSEFQSVPLPFLASLAKREEEIFVPGKSDSHLFAKGSAELAVLQTVRDEAHRFAIGFNRAKRTKEMKKNILEELPGFGPATRKKLLKIAGSVR